MENVIKRTNPGCVIKTVHPWFKSTATVECYNSNNGYIVGITEDDWVNVIPPTIKCPRDFEIIFPTYPTEDTIKSNFTFPPICLARRYFPRSISCPGILLRNGLIVTDRYIVDNELNPTPFKQKIDVSHYSCQVQSRVKPNIVCPIINMDYYSRLRYVFPNNEYYLNSHFNTEEVINYQSGLFDFTSYSNFLNENPNIINELKENQLSQLSNLSDTNSTISNSSISNSNLNDSTVSISNDNDNSTLKSSPYYNNKAYKNEFHEYKYYYNDTLNKHLKSMNDYNNHEYSYYPFRLNTTLDNPWNTKTGNNINSNLRREDHRKVHSIHSKGSQIEKVVGTKQFDKEYNNFLQGLKKDLSKQKKYFNDYQWDFLSKFYRVYISDQYKFVSNIPVSSISHKALTIDGGYQLNINLDPTYQSFVNYTLENMKMMDSELEINNLRDNLNDTMINKNDNVTDSNISNDNNTNSSNNNITENNMNMNNSQLIEKLLILNDTNITNNLNFTRDHEYNAWEKSARIYFMDLDLMKKNQIIYSSISNYKHKRKFPFLYYYGRQPSINNDYGHIRRPAISDHKYRYGSPAEDYHKYSGRHENSDLLYYINKHLNQTKPYRHSPGPQTYHNCISINETTPIIECPNSKYYYSKNVLYLI
ncbi:hypothetical protein [Cryptosporidium hominis TU502]|uniref:hypothetical protein n=1 Tax=Cryptosporidium hominis (strain TU502) TaxID=353151 RepID=UPI00004533E4|nr:hypothetical protein [Cryptosporidium hominis TU502]